jgi:hypothetical protein
LISITQPEVQSRLLEFISDALLTELLAEITKFMSLIEQKDLQAQAKEKAMGIF